MWIKKTESEIEQEEKLLEENLNKNKLKNLAFVFFGSLLFVFIISSIGALTTSGRYIKVYGYPLTFKEYEDSISYFIFFSLKSSLFCFIVALVFYRSFFKKSKSKTFMCDKCFNKKIIKDKKINCDCGGTFNAMDDYKWNDGK